jgi:hypothetical protein
MGERAERLMMGDFLKALVVTVVAFLFFTFPATWLLMLFIGNFDLGVSYWGTLPMGILVSFLLGGVLSRPW